MTTKHEVYVQSDGLGDGFEARCEACPNFEQWRDNETDAIGAALVHDQGRDA